MNIRFWVYHQDSIVKITLCPFKPFNVVSGGPDDEGWWISGDTYEWLPDQDIVTRRSFSDGVDCDGRMSSQYDSECTRAQIDCAMVYMGQDPKDPYMSIYGPAKMPAWKEVNHSFSQRDYSAEAAGY